MTLFLFLFITSLLKADSLFVSPSFYYTNGNYNNKSVSNAYSFFSSLQLTEKVFLINEYEELGIDNPAYSYNQHTFLAGTYAVYFPWYLKLNYAHLMGDYKGKSDKSKYSDLTNIYNADASIFYEWFYLGAVVTYLHQSGYKEQSTGQVTLRIERVISDEIYLSLKPNYSTLLDGRKLWSVAMKAHYLITPSLLMKAGGFLGERAYYFDSDLLTIFNQEYTQKNQVFGQAEYSFTPAFKTILSYQHTTFSDFSINYFVAGIKYWFYL